MTKEVYIFKIFDESLLIYYSHICMKNALFVIILFVIASITNCAAQVTIGANSQPNATLDVRSQGNIPTSHDGIIPPKLTGDQLAGKDRSAYGMDQDGAIIYVTEAASPANQIGTTVNVKGPGYYYFDFLSNVWTELGHSEPGSKWFYMPPSLINTEPGVGKIIDLYNTYISSTTSTIGVIKSGAADFTQVNPILQADEYDYYVLGYDNTLFDHISISTSGVMTYDVIGRATNESYITIVFAKK